MKAILILFALSFALMVSCKKADYSCHQKVTVIKVFPTNSDSSIQYSNYQIIGYTKCVTGVTSKETLNLDSSKTIVITDTECK
jgi:hypothetical protein